MQIKWQIEEFMCYCQSKQLRKKTMGAYEQSLNLFTRYLQETHNITEVEQVKEMIIRKYLVNLQERGKYTLYSDHEATLQNYPERRRDFRSQISACTINNYIRCIKVFFNYLEQGRIVKNNPMKSIKEIPNKRKAKDFISDDDYKKLMSKMDISYFSEYRDYVIINILMDTGMRIGECLSLTMSDIDIKQRMVHLKEEITKGRKDRTVFYSQKMAQVLRSWLQFKDRYCESIFLFPVKKTSGQVSISCFETNFKGYIRRVGISENITPHALRNNFAKRCLMSGMDIYTLSRILGHSSVKVTEEAYLDLSDNDLKINYQKYSPLENML